jgi:serine/threonine protein kinase
MSNGAVEALAICGGATVNGTDVQESALVGTTLEGAYRITRPIGEGGMSAVYEAVQLRLNKRVAVKVMARELALNEEALARFHREAEITSHLGHPHLVTVMDFGTAPTGQPYLVMEYLEGTDLAQRIHQKGRLPLETAVHITKQAASALAVAHDQGVVHRDLKPENVFLVVLPDEPDFVKILDFGISKVRAARTQLTNASTIIGTPDYMSPEQATGMLDEIDHRTDQWALACIVWQMLSGRPPFAGDDVSAVFYQIIHLAPQPLRKRIPDLPPAVEAVLRRALSKNITDRYPSIRDFAHALEIAAVARPVEVALPPVQVPQDPSGRSGGAGEAPQKERRGQRERRRSNPAPPFPLAASRAGDHELEVATRASFRQKFKPIYAISAVALGLVLGAALFSYRVGKSAESAAPPTVARPAGASPSMASPPVVTDSPVPMPSAQTPAPSNPVAAVAAPDGSMAKSKKPGLDDIAWRPTVRAGKQKPEAGDDLVPDPSDPFAPPRRRIRSNPEGAGSAVPDSTDPFQPTRLASKHKAGRAGKADSDFVDPFGP